MRGLFYLFIRKKWVRPMTDQIDIRPTTGADLPAIDALLRESYPVLLKPHYAPSVLVTALPLIARAACAFAGGHLFHGRGWAGPRLGGGGLDP